MFSVNLGLISSIDVCSSCACKPLKPTESSRCYMPWAKASHTPLYEYLLLTVWPERCHSLPFYR